MSFSLQLYTYSNNTDFKSKAMRKILFIICLSIFNICNARTVQHRQKIKKYHFRNYRLNVSIPAKWDKESFIFRTDNPILMKRYAINEKDFLDFAFENADSVQGYNLLANKGERIYKTFSSESNRCNANTLSVIYCNVFGGYKEDHYTIARMNDIYDKNNEVSMTSISFLFLHDNNCFLMTCVLPDFFYKEYKPLFIKIADSVYFDD